MRGEEGKTGSWSSAVILGASTSRSANIYISFQSTAKVRTLGFPRCLLFKLAHVLAYSTNKNEYGLTDVASTLAGLKFPVLHWHEKITEPAERHCTQLGIELIPKNQRYCTGESSVANLMGSRTPATRHNRPRRVDAPDGLDFPN